MRYGFVIDQDRCIGCHACTIACKEEHNIPIGVFRTWVKYIEKGEFPNVSRHFGVMRCNHCDDAPCIEICPTTSLYRRDDGIVDFDPARCIGCKSCMQACPYDALYIDPASNTAAKCNYCAHRIEMNLEPACVIVCPTRAIIAGDLDDSSSAISRIVATQKVVSRKPHKGTAPKLYYIGIDGDLLEPAAPQSGTTYLWADKPVEERRLEVPADHKSVSAPGSSCIVYDVAHPAPWGWRIAVYLWTKSIAAGVLIVAAIFQDVRSGREFESEAPAIAIVFTLLTAIMLIADLKRPDRFYLLLTKPNFRSWVTKGAYVLILYGALAAAWLALSLFGRGAPPLLRYAAAIAGIFAAAYSAFLFAQARGRELWQSPMFFWQLIAQAIVAGAATLLITARIEQSPEEAFALLRITLAISLEISIAIAAAELMFSHGSVDARIATEFLVRGPLRWRFFLGALSIGLVLPLLLLMLNAHSIPVDLAASLLALAGIWLHESGWIEAGQAVPLS